MKQLLTLLTLISCASFAQAQEIAGKVLDDGFEPLIGVHVMNKQTRQGVTTNLNGEFSIHAAYGDTLNISFIGFQEIDYVVLTENPLIKLRTSSYRLRDFTVYGDRIGIKVHGMPPIEENLKLKNVEMGTDFQENPNLIPVAGPGASFSRKQYNDKKARQERKLPEVIEKENRVSAYYQLADDLEFIAILRQVNPTINLDMGVILVEFIATYKEMVLSSTIEEVKASLLIFVSELK